MLSNVLPFQQDSDLQKIATNVTLGLQLAVWERRCPSLVLRAWVALARWTVWKIIISM